MRALATERLLWVVPPSWGIAAAVVALGWLTLVVLSSRLVLQQRRAGSVRIGAVVLAASSWAVAVLVALAAVAFLLHDQVRFVDGVLA